MIPEERNESNEELYRQELSRILGKELPAQPEPSLTPIQVQEPDLGRWLNNG